MAATVVPTAKHCLSRVCKVKDGHTVDDDIEDVESGEYTCGSRADDAVYEENGE